ncbi:MAG: glycosyltransferase family 4 protein [Acidimicrobiia bacterium]|jgi:glycosyltransferase involved in cell wall biosynthesis|nr:glycosyltransferase family 4 protein [Acidimicrobiia bacterium]
MSRSVAARLTGDAILGRITDRTPHRVRAALGNSATAAPAERAAPAVATRPGRRKLVVLSTFTMAPALGGGQVRGLHLYGALTARFDVELLCLAQAYEHAGDAVLAPGLRQVVVPRSAEQRRVELEWERGVGTTVSDVLAGELVTSSGPYLDALRRALAEADAVLLAHPYLLPALGVLDVEVPVVYDAHNCELALKELVLGGAPRADELLGRVRAVEAAALRAAVLTTVCSSADADELTRRYDDVDVRDLLLVPNGVDVGATPFTTGGERDQATAAFLGRYRPVRRRPPSPRHLAVFFGSWHPPNVAAAEAIIAVADELPTCLFVLAGSHVSSIPRRGLPANVARLGVVSDASKHALLGAATVALNPVVSGSGTNLKLVEALAAGAPVVSTVIGARGMPSVDGTHLRLCEPGRLATAVAEVLDDPARHDRARAGRALVERDYDWTVLGQRMAGAIERRLP